MGPLRSADQLSMPHEPAQSADPHVWTWLLNQHMVGSFHIKECQADALALRIYQ
jgi:hypothetical protein